MPGTLHQGILLLFQDDPWLGFDVLGIPRPVDGVPIDRRGEIERDGRKAYSVRQGFPDLVMVGRDPEDDTRGAVLTVEAQTDINHEKRWIIPVYQSHLADDHRLACWVFVVSLEQRVSKALREWARGDPPRVDAMLIDVDTVSKSWLDDPARPTAAVLAGALHGYAGDYDAARKGFLAARACPERRRQRYGMTILTALPKDQREQLIQELPMHEQNSWLEVERRSGTYQVGREAGRTEGRTEGRQEGREEGRAVLLELIFEQLAEHNVLVDAQSEARIRSCDDLQTLQRWVRRSFCATSVAELFEG